ncbi:hypothetical protein BD410DRAFT_790255 [Rickenella mellea]|uniref:HNH nuclease domain-containing protein n=1 Tax=Rickenella mellea TaxID=50990 RepID=A0A4Y7Q101_9AGAM|nr:hypothetical protein BD410DRAFT_790255 [Rickenella mellea]
MDSEPHHERVVSVEMVDNLADGITTLRLRDTSAMTVLAEELNDSTSPTEEFVRKAEQYIRYLPRNVSTSVYKVRVRVLLESMLGHAPCPGGKRYAAVAITAFGRGNNDGDISVQGLTLLADKWISCILLPFKSSHKMDGGLGHMSADTPLTPSLSETKKVFDPENTPDRDGRLRDQVIRRQGGQCAVISCPKKVLTEASHIFKRALVSKKTKNGEEMKSTQRETLDMLHHYGGISLSNLERRIDDPENGILLQMEMHTSFDKFEWCFEAMDEPNTYEIKWFGDEIQIFADHGLHVVKFRNHAAGEHIALPERKYLKLHAAIAHVLHDTGIGESLDTMLEIFNPHSAVVPYEKYQGQNDLALRAMIMELTDNSHHLPEHPNIICNATDDMAPVSQRLPHPNASCYCRAIENVTRTTTD